MSVYKYLHSLEDSAAAHADPRRQADCLGIEIYRMPGSNRTIPVVVTAESDRVSTNWWDYAKGQWRSHYRMHVEKPCNQQGAISMIPHMPWSNRVAVAGHEERVFVLFKRQLVNAFSSTGVNIWLDLYEWDPAISELGKVTNGIPVEIPLGDSRSDQLSNYIKQAGYWVWCGVDNIREDLLVLLQAFRKPDTGLVLPPDFDMNIPGLNIQFDDPIFDELGVDRTEVAREWYSREELGATISPRSTPEPVLLLLKAPVSATVQELRKAQTWTAQELGEGGWDFDAVLVQDMLHVVFREEYYSFEVEYGVNNPQDDHTVSITTQEDSRLSIRPLRYRSINLDTLAIEQNVELPGGEHPQFQALNPVSITVDRISSGQWVIAPPQTYSSRSVAVRLEAYQKCLIIEEPIGNWASGALMQESFRNLPRNIFHRIFPSWHGFMRVLGKSNALEFATLDPFMPVYQCGAGSAVIDGFKGRTVKILHHGQQFDSLGISCFSYAVNGSEVSVSDGMTTYLPIDVNHEQAVPVWSSENSTATPTTAENTQFLPYESTPLDGGTYRFRADNTLGGSLAKERLQDGLSFYAYTDLGDGGTRVVFEDDLIVPEGGQPANLKTFNIGTTTVPGASQLDWIQIDATDWKDAELPFMPQFPDILSGWGNFWTRTNAGEPGEVRTLYSGLFSMLDVITENANRGPVAVGDVVVIHQDTLQDLETIIEIARSSTNSDTERVDLWEKLWLIASFDPETDDAALHRDNSGFYVQFYDQEYTIGPYEMKFRYRERNGELKRDRIEIYVRGDNCTAYRFRAGQTQGRVDYRFTLTFQVHTINWSLKPYDLKHVSTKFDYIRSFTPAILMCEERSEDPLESGSQLDSPNELTKDEAAVLSMKPVGDTRIEARSTEASVGVAGLGGYIVSGLIAIFSGTILGVLVHELVILMQAIIGSFPWNPYIGIAIAVAVAIFFFWVLLPPIIEGIVRRKIKEQVESEEQRQRLDREGFMNYAGEGCAEAIARRLLTEANNPSRPVDHRGILGWNRFQGQYWQTVVVTAGKLRMLVLG